MSGVKPEKNRVQFSCSSGHVLSAGPSLWGQTRPCPKCGEMIQIPVPDDEEEDVSDIMEALMGGKPDEKAGGGGHALSSFYRPPATIRGENQAKRRCPNCQTLNPANYRFCRNCNEQLTFS